MYRKIVWCYVLVLTLLDISLHTKLTAQGKSHDVNVHDSLIEGISFQEWGKDADESAVGSSAAASALRLEPAALRFGPAALGAAHALTVTLTNTHNATVHLASVAGTTPDFHASFFESKILPPNGNTTFSVVYLGRREGPVTAYLYIHTSLGVHKYPVSAEGVASEWGVWPLVGLQVPHNATLDPVLTLYNPTDKHIQVREVYSSGAWVGLRLPGGGGAAPRAAWRVPPHAERALVRLKLRLPHPGLPRRAHQPHQPHVPPEPAARPLTAYIRIKGENVGGGGGLVVAVEATVTEAGSFLMPPQLRLRVQGSRDRPHTFDISAGNSGSSPVRVEASVWGARCGPRPLHIPPPPVPDHHRTANGQLDRATTNGVKTEGAHVTVLRPQLDAHQESTPTLQLTLDYARLWASYESARPELGLWCGGYVRLGACSVPYSLRLLPGTLTLTPHQLEVVTARREEALREREVRVRNEFRRAVLVSALEYPPELHKLFHVVEHTPLVLAPGEAAVVARVRLRSAAIGAQLHSHLALRTNLTRLQLPVLLHSGALQLEWDWPHSADGHVRVGAVGTSSTTRIGVQLHNPTPAALCVREHSLQLPAAQFQLPACRCINPGGRAQAWLTVVAPARPGPLTGSLRVSTPHADTSAAVSLHARAGRLHAPPLRLPPAAPFAGSSAPLVLDNSMSLGMRVLYVTQPQTDRAVTFVPLGSDWVATGRHVMGSVHYAPERACEPHCYTGLDINTPEGAAWLRRGSSGGEGDGEGEEAALRLDAELLRARRATFTPRKHDISLYLHTSEVVQIPVTGSVRLEWPRLRVEGDEAGGAGGAGGLLGGVGAATRARLRLRNPSSRPLLLQPALTPRPHHAPTLQHAHHDPDHLLHPQDVEGIESFCKKNKCVWSHEAFSISAWQATAPNVTEWLPGNGTRSPMLLLSPGAEVELTITMTPTTASPLAAYLYLRNNLTVVEIVPVWGRGAFPSVELGGRSAGSQAPLLFEVTECSEVASGGSVVRRTLAVRNTGDVPLTLRDWRLAGRPCQARGFRLAPCAPLALAPNETRSLRLSFAADYTLARVACALHVRADARRLAFALAAHAPATLLRACGARVPPPPFEPALRGAGALVAVAALVLVLAAAALDAERELRRARAHRCQEPPAARAPLDLRAAAPAAPAPAPARAPAPPPRRRRARRQDPAAERRAFERWRAEVLRRAGPGADPDADPDPDDYDRSSEDAPPGDQPPRLPPTRDSSPSPPTPTDRRSSDEEGPSLESSVGSDSSPGDADGDGDVDELGRDDTDEPDERPRAAPQGPARVRRLPGDPDNRAEDASRTPRARRSAHSPRRRARRADDPRARAPAPAPAPAPSPAPRAACPAHKPPRRRLERPHAAPALEPRAAPPAAAAAAAAVRWDTTWSEVVAAGAAPHASTPAAAAAAAHAGTAPLPPIGSDVRRRAEAERPAADNSLFYFNGEQPPPAAWRATPPLERAYPPPPPDYRADFDDPASVNGHAYGGSLWTGPGSSAWAWGGAGAGVGVGVGGAFAGVRPPPGFPAARAYDPFRSLAAIWAPGALDWRADPDPAAPAPAPAVGPNPNATATATTASSRSVASKTE